MQGPFGPCRVQGRALPFLRDGSLRRLASIGALLLVSGLGVAGAGPTLLVPLERSCVTSPFGMRGGQMHSGADLRAPAGAWVRAAAPGVVVALRRRGGLGLEVDLRHADGSLTRYAHLGTVTPSLAVGQRKVALGERIGRVGRTGTTRGTHLHFEVQLDGRPVDPVPLLGLAPCSTAP